MAFGKPGRPAEDRQARQREIYLRVAPLILERGARRLSMDQASRAACMSIGGLYHYFPNKRELVLHGLRPEVYAALCTQYRDDHATLPTDNPEAQIEAFIDFSLRQVEFVRPALHAALELGADTVFPALDAGINAGLDGFVGFLREAVPALATADLEVLARGFRRTCFAAMLDKTITPDELRVLLSALLHGMVARRWPHQHRPDPPRITPAATA